MKRIILTIVMVILIGCSFVSCGNEPRNYTQEREEIRQEQMEKTDFSDTIKVGSIQDSVLVGSIQDSVKNMNLSDLKAVLTGMYNIQDSMPSVDAIKKHYEKLGGNIEITEYQHSIIVKGWDKNRKTVDDEWIYNEERGKFYVYYDF